MTRGPMRVDVRHLEIYNGYMWERKELTKYHIQIEVNYA